MLKGGPADRAAKELAATVRAEIAPLADQLRWLENEIIELRAVIVAGGVLIADEPEVVITTTPATPLRARVRQAGRRLADFLLIREYTKEVKEGG